MAKCRKGKCEVCGKHIFPNALEAKIWLWKVQRRDWPQKRAYPCPVGNGYHVTKKK